MRATGVATDTKPSGGMAGPRPAARGLPLTLVAPAWIAVPALAVLAGLLVRGYQFGVTDHFEFVPLVRHARDAGVLAGDWYVDAAASSGVRQGFSVLMAALSSALGEWPSFLAVQVATVALLALGIHGFARALGFSSRVGATAALLAVLGTGGGLGQSFLLEPLLIPASIAWALLAWALLATARRRFEVAGALVGLVALVHPQIAAVGGVSIAAWSILGGAPRPSPAHALAAVGIAGVVGAPSLGPVLAGTLAPATIDASAVVDTLVHLRMPWHMDPGAFGWNEWLGFCTALGAAAVTWRDPGLAPLRRLMVVACGAVLVGALGVGLAVPLIVKLQLFRITPLVSIALSIVVASRLTGRASRGRIAGASPRWIDGLARLLVGAALVMTVAGSTDAHQALMPALVPLLLIAGRLRPDVEPGRRTVLLAVAVGLAVVVAWAAYAVHQGDLRVVTGALLVATALSVVPEPAPDRPRAQVRGWPAWVAVAAAVLIAVQVAWPVNPFEGRVDPVGSPGDDLDRLAAWASGNVPRDSLVLAPPGESGWRFWSGIPEVVDFQAFPFRDADAAEWIRRLRDVTGRDDLALGLSPVGPNDEVDAAYAARTPSELGEVARRYDAQYLVVASGSAAACRPLASQGAWVLVGAGDSCVR